MNKYIKVVLTCFFSITIHLCSQEILSQEIIAVEKIKPGMKGVCRTVFSGYVPEEFPIEVVEIWENFQPKRNLILIHLKGEKAEHTGVAAGMSGSPVYINGKLAGALAYSIGVFMKDPLAGVTPIAEMLDIFDKEKKRAEELAATVTAGNKQFLEMALGLESTEWENFLPISSLNQATHVTSNIKPLLLPLNFSGMKSSLVAKAGELLQSQGFLAASAGQVQKKETAEKMIPGSAIGAVLITGDAGIQAIGTVTYRAGNKVLAFGHPFFNSGPVNMPISLAKILTIAPSELSAFKLGAGSGIVGALRQDRATGIYGEIGAIPRLIPLKVQYTDESGQDEIFNFEFTDEASLNSMMPLFLRFILVNALESARMATGENSLILSGKVRLQNGQTIELNNFYPGVFNIRGVRSINSILQSSGEIAAVLGTIMTNNFKTVGLNGVELHFSSIAGKRNASVEQVWLDRTTVEPGDTITAFARIKPYQKEPVVVKHHIVVPISAKGRYLSLFIGGSQELIKTEQRTHPTKYVVYNFKQLLSLLNTRRRHDYLYFQLRISDNGLAVGGNELSALPPTAYAVLGSGYVKGNASRIRERVLVETHQSLSTPKSSLHDHQPLPFAISGGKNIRLLLK